MLTQNVGRRDFVGTRSSVLCSWFGPIGAVVSRDFVGCRSTLAASSARICVFILRRDPTKSLHPTAVPGGFSGPNGRLTRAAHDSLEHGSKGTASSSQGAHGAAHGEPSTSLPRAPRRAQRAPTGRALGRAPGGLPSSCSASVGSAGKGQGRARGRGVGLCRYRGGYRGCPCREKGAPFLAILRFSIGNQNDSETDLIRRDRLFIRFDGYSRQSIAAPLAAEGE